MQYPVRYSGTPQTYADLEARIAEWGAAQSDIHAILVIGSRARSSHAADEWSDLDLIVFTTDVARYAADSAWLNVLGTMWASGRSQTGRGDPEWEAVFEGGLKADFVLVDMTPVATLQAMIDASPYQAVLARGLRVLYSSTPSFSVALNDHQSAPVPPSQDEFTNTVHLILIDTTRFTKFLQRGDLWRAKQVSDVALRNYLLTLLEWHARAIRGPAIETWYYGRFLEEWADPRALIALPDIFSNYERDDIWRSLDAYLDLCYWLAVEIAARLGYPHPSEAWRQVRAWIATSRQKGNA